MTRSFNTRCSEACISGRARLICLEPSFQLPLLLPRFDEVYARSYCFSAHYIYHLLVNGYKFTEETWPQIHFKKEVSQGMCCFLPLLSKVCVNMCKRKVEFTGVLVLSVCWREADDTWAPVTKEDTVENSEEVSLETLPT